MSQYDPSPPMPPQFIPGIEYSIPRQARRPGIITAIGVMSIVVGSLTLLGTFIVGGYSTILFGFSKIASSAQATVAPAAAPVLVTTAPTTSSDDQDVVTALDPDTASVGPDKGISVPASKIIADGVHTFHRLSKARRDQFENFLQQAGTVGGFEADENGTLPDVKKTVIEDRTMPPVTAGALPTDVLVTAYGRIEIYDEGVAFMPSDGSPAMRTAIGTTGTTPIGAGANPAASGALTATEAQAVITSLQASSSNALNPAQIAALTADLQKPGQTLVTPGTNSNQYTYAYSPGDGSTVVMMNGGQVTLDANGKMLKQTTAAAAFAAPILQAKVNMTAFAAVMIESVLSGVLAIYLIISGIFVLRQSLLASKLHWIYIALKIPIAIVGAIALPALWYSFVNSMSAGMPGSGGPMKTDGFIVWGVVFGALAIAYPIGLIFALSSRTTRGYYHSVAGTAQ